MSKFEFTNEDIMEFLDDVIDNIEDRHMFETHIDDLYKLGHIKKRLEKLMEEIRE